MGKVYYDLHIHSCLSPCADDDMTPVNIVGSASLVGLDVIAISDHNAIGNVLTAMQVGEKFGVVVVPAIELQTAEDIHILCLFRDYLSLESFYNSIHFTDMKNRADIFGHQYIIDKDDNIVSEYTPMLLCGSDMSVGDVKKAVHLYGGIAVPAHIDRQSNGIVGILGSLPDEFGLIEVSGEKTGNCIKNSDAHTLLDIRQIDSMELRDKTIDSLFAYLEELDERAIAKHT